MLAKRLDLWRLANFRLERLASAEDVYLFHGVAHDNPKDSRLFALAEIRDLTPVVDGTGGRSYPWLGRMGVQCLAAMRRGTGYVPRARTSDLEPDRALRPAVVGRAPALVADLARTFAPLAEGVGLQKVLLRVRIAEPERVAERRGPGRAGRGRPGRDGAPAAAPQRADAPAHAVPAEGAQGRAVRGALPLRDPADADAPGRVRSADFPPGTFVEHDLDADGHLEPVDRESGLNTANVVVGVL